MPDILRFIYQVSTIFLKSSQEQQVQQLLKT